MFGKMKRPVALVVAAVALMATACTGTASAATTAKPPTPHCNYEWPRGPIDPPCTCPHGWHVVYPDWWDYILEEPACVKNK